MDPYIRIQKLNIYLALLQNQSEIEMLEN